MTTYIFGCMEEDNQNTTNGNGNNDNGGSGDFVFKAMDVEITNIEYQYSIDPMDPPRPGDLIVTCDAINYGGTGQCVVVICVNGTNSSIKMEQIVPLDENQQVELYFEGKSFEEPINITGYTKRETSGAITGPKSPEMDIETVNLFYDIHGWVDENQTELSVSITLTAINYESPGYVTIVVEAIGENFAKKMEERIYIGWFQYYDLNFDMNLPGIPVNITAQSKRPQPDV
jgi:hypothetical protein